MDYQWHYDRLIETRKNRKLETNFETHHIIPKSLGGTNDRENLINLTPREHFLAHWLLWKIHKNRQMSFAFFSMCQYRKGKRKEFKISSRAYEEARLSRTVTGISEETRMKMSLAKKGKKASPETRMKISLVQLGKEPWNKGKKGVSEATRQRMIKRHRKPD